MARRPRRIVLPGVLAGLGVLLAAEGALRVRERYLYGTFSRAATTIMEPASGTILNKPGARIEGTRLTVHVNALGFRGREVVSPKPRGTFRIVCIGGSTTFDIYARNDEETWPGRLEQLLREKHPRVEVVNAGVAAHTLAVSLGPAVWPKIESVEPDLLVVYHASNEISELCRKTYGAQAPPPPARSALARRATDWSLLAFKLALVADRLFPPPEPLGKGELPGSGLPAFEANLRELVRRAREKHQGVALATVGVRWSEDAPADEREALLRGAPSDFVGLSPAGIAHAFLRYNEAIERVARDTRVLLVPVAPWLNGRAECFGDITHQSPEGSRVIATLVASALEGAGAIPDQRASAHE